MPKDRTIHLVSYSEFLFIQLKITVLLKLRFGKLFPFHTVKLILNSRWLKESMGKVIQNRNLPLPGVGWHLSMTCNIHFRRHNLQWHAPRTVRSRNGSWVLAEYHQRCCSQRTNYYRRKYCFLNAGPTSVKNWKVRGTDGPCSDQGRLKGNRRIEREIVKKTNTWTPFTFLCSLTSLRKTE